MSTPLSPREIQRWYPSRWDQVAGNSAIVTTWLDMIQNGPCNALFTGPHRTGKTRTISLGLQSLFCPHRTRTLDGCGTCASCTLMKEARSPHTGLYSTIAGSGFSFVPVDCQTVTPEDFRAILKNADLEDLRTVIYLDEVAALGRRGIETSLLKPIDESPCIWIASAITVNKPPRKGQAARVDGLSAAMQARFAIKVGTALPTVRELTQWVKDRCREWEIGIEQPELVLPALIKGSGHRVGYVILALADAAARGRRLTPEQISRFNFGSPD